MAAKPGKSTDILDAVALIVVDMQNSILDVIEDAPAVIQRCGFAIEAARTLGLRVVFTEQVPAKLGPTDPRLLALVPQARVFAKNTFSALQADGLLDYLRRQGTYHLLLVGIEIPVCIYQTALHAVDSDLDVTILSDAVAGRRMDDSLVTLEALTRAHCHLLPAEAVYYSMLGNSGHPLFSAFNALVKRYAQPGGLDAAPPPAPRENQFERRPVLAAPEDESDEPAAAELAADSADSANESEPYIGRADTARESPEPAEHDDDSPDDDDNGEGDDTETGDDDSPGADESAPRTEQGGGGGGEVRGDQGGPGDSGGRRRGRRRRGGARRRRSRERRDGLPPGNSNAPQGASGGGAGGQPDRGAEARPSEGERAPE